MMRRRCAGPHGSKVAVIEGGDLGNVEALGLGDKSCIDGAEREVGVGSNEVGRGGCKELEVAGRDRAED